MMVFPELLQILSLSHPLQLLYMQLITIIVFNFQRRKHAQWVLIEEV